MTVSKVVRGCADVGAETRSRVMARIKELNYQPNWVARSLAARRTFMIGLIVPDLMHSFFAEIAKGVSADHAPAGLRRGDLQFRRGQRRSSRARWTACWPAGGRPDSGLRAGALEPRSIFEPHRGARRALRADRPAHCGGSRRPMSERTTKPSAASRPRHLIERGCRRIAHIAGRRIAPGSGRYKGYRDALAAAGIYDSRFVRGTCLRRRQRLRRRAAPACDSTPAPTASSATTTPPPPAP